jgi:hypothetical protein
MGWFNNSERFIVNQNVKPAVCKYHGDEWLEYQSHFDGNFPGLEHDHRPWVCVICSDLDKEWVEKGSTGDFEEYVKSSNN